MALLKEDGSLDIERYNSLPLEEWTEEFATLTDEQVDEYISKLPVNESKEPVRAIKVDYLMEEDGVDAEDFLNNQRKKHGIV